MKKTLFVPAVLVLSATSPLFAAENPTVCTAHYAPVCGQIDGKEKTYGNACVLGAAGAKQVYEGECREGTTDSRTDTVAWATANGITVFKNVNDFGYDRTMSREEAAAFAVRFGTNILGKETKTCTPAESASSRSSLAHFYSDAHKIDETLIKWVDQACGMGIMTGSDTFFSPHRDMTKSEALAVMVRAIDGKKNEKNGNPWYGEYRTYAEKFGLSLGDQNLDTPITRGTAIEWMKTLSDAVEAKKPTVLEGKWKLQNVTGYSDSEVRDLDVVLTIEWNRLGTKICNSLGGNFTLGQDSNTIHAPAIVSTLMYCEGAAGKIENDFMVDGAKYQIEKNKSLVITTKEWVKFSFEAVAVEKEEAKKLLGEWKLISYNDQVLLNSQSGAYDHVKVTFEAERVSGKFCNSLGGGYAVDGSTLKTNGLVMTEMYCHDETLMKMENSFAHLDGAKWERFTLNTLVATDEPYNRLKLTLANGDVFTFGAANEMAK